MHNLTVDGTRQCPRSSLAGRPVALASLGQTLDLPGVHVVHPFPALPGGWGDPRVVRNGAVTQGMNVRPIPIDPRP